MPRIELALNPASFNLPCDQRVENDLLICGWQEISALPELGIELIGTKLDSGAWLSTLHASRISRFSHRRQTWVRFDSVCQQNGVSQIVQCEAKLARNSTIRSSNGSTESRPTIETTLHIGGFRWNIEVTLRSRELLECSLLLGRSALAGRCLIDTSRTHLLSRRA